VSTAKRILVIGDAHVAPGQNLRRFKALGNYIKAEKPDVIVEIGDFLTLDSLSDWDRNKRLKMEGRRYEKEIIAGNRALDLLESDALDRAKKYKVKGNHENRLDRYLDHDPTFAGQVGIEKDLLLKERGYSVVEYRDHVDVNGISFTHIPISGLGKPIGEPNVTRKALQLYNNSVVFGHCHTLSHSAEHRTNAPHLNQALSAGCFFEHIDEYAVGSKTDYWRGVVLLTSQHNNRFDIETTSMSRLLRSHG
jgi:predicted phosphodiesterase